MLAGAKEGTMRINGLTKQRWGHGRGENIRARGLIRGGRMTTRFVICADSHGDYICPDTSREFLAFVRRWKPTHRVHLGDVFDFRWLRKKATEQEQRETIHPDLDAGLAFLRAYKPTAILWGNHDRRVTDGLASDRGPMVALCSSIVDRITGAMPRGCLAAPYDKRSMMTLANMRLVHGMASGVNALRQTMAVYGGDGAAVVMGHLHRHEYLPRASIGGGYGTICPCLCRLDLPYNAVTPSSLAQASGWLYGEIENGRASIRCEIVKESKSCPVVIPI